MCEQNRIKIFKKIESEDLVMETADIRFRDRQLKKGEKSNYHCGKCSIDIPHDLIHTHICRSTVILDTYTPQSKLIKRIRI